MSESVSNPTSQPVVSNPSTNVWCRSICETFKINCEWTIEKFVSQESLGFPSRFIKGSAEMSAKEFPDLKWSFVLQFAPDLSCFYVYLLLKNDATRDIPFLIKSAYVNKKNEKILNNERLFVSKAGSSDRQGIAALSTSKIHYDNLLSDEGHLTLSCEMEALRDIKNSSSQTRHDQPQLLCGNQLNSLIENFEKLFENNILSDITLLAGGKKFQAHRAILAARSPVFQSMFQQEMKEKFCGEVDVLDVEPDVLEQVLRFIYTDRVSATKMEDLATGLLAAADKYLLENLKNECENHLKSETSNENCIEILLLADRHSAENLKQYALNFFRGNMAQVMASDGWKKAKEMELVRLFEMLKTVFN